MDIQILLLNKIKLLHTNKKALGVEKGASEISSWRYPEKKMHGQQIDLLIDCRDLRINVCETNSGPCV